MEGRYAAVYLAFFCSGFSCGRNKKKTPSIFRVWYCVYGVIVLTGLREILAWIWCTFEEALGVGLLVVLTEGFH